MYDAANVLEKRAGRDLFGKISDEPTAVPQRHIMKFLYFFRFS
jgi:hypothetical protein